MALQWTEQRKPCEAIPYNHTIAETPFGRFVLTWKGWKENWNMGMGFDETPWGAAEYNIPCTVEEAKAWAEKQMAERCWATLETILGDPPSARGIDGIDRG